MWTDFEHAFSPGGKYGLSLKDLVQKAGFVGAEIIALTIPISFGILLKI